MSILDLVYSSIFSYGKFGYKRVFEEVSKKIDSCDEIEIFNIYCSFAKKRIYYSSKEIITYEIISSDKGRYEKKTCKRVSK